MIKSLFDFIFCFLFLILLIPFFLVISLAIKMQSTGNVFYLQERIGKNGKPFYMIKFRSMYSNADKSGLLTIGTNDSRITPIGLFLRKYKIDELPQLINVLKGEMSLIGPRPEVKKYVDLYNNYQRLILSVKPGITDLASIRYSKENVILGEQINPIEYYIRIIMPHKIRINMIYIRKQNFFLDMYIIYLTLRKVFFS